MKEYRRILWKHRYFAAGLSLLLILLAAVDVATGYSLGSILTACDAEEPLTALLWASFTCASLFIVDMIMDYGSRVCLLHFRKRIKHDLRELVGNKLAGSSYSDFVQKDTGAYVSWLNNDVEQLYLNCFEKLFLGIGKIFAAIFAFGVMVASSWYIGLTALILFVLQFAAPQIFAKVLEKATKEGSEALEVSVEGYKDSIMGVGIFYLSNLRHRILERILNTSDRAERKLFLTDRTKLRVDYFNSGISMINQLVLIAAATVAVILDAAPAGIILSVGNLCAQFFNGVLYSVQSFMGIRASKALWEKFEQKEQAAVEKKAMSAVDEIRMEDICFSYGDRVILKERDFSFEAGGKYAIVGESGSGKTTVLKLLMGLLPEYEGKIFYNQQEQRDSDMTGFYEQAAYVDQQVYLFQDSLRFNIALGEAYSDQEIMEAVRACKLEDLVASLPEGLDSIIQENGKNLSGGQRQRIALARGFIRKVKYMILDEGTSALDEENALDIEENLMEQDDLCVIIITHQLHDSVRDRLTACYTL